MCSESKDFNSEPNTRGLTSLPTYRGNLGNLMQHWVLSELVSYIGRSVEPTACLGYVDAHAMSPFATRSINPGKTAAEFDWVSTNLPGAGSVFERTWKELRTSGAGPLPVEYPTSALLVRRLWGGNVNFTLCEADEETANQISLWLSQISMDGTKVLHRGDWRKRFQNAMPSAPTVYLMSFDPYMFDRHGRHGIANPGHMYPSDIFRVGATIRDMERAPIVLQFSTYSANNDNAQGDVILSVEPVFAAAGLQLNGIVKANGNMMSLVFSRDYHGIAELNLPQRFPEWLRDVRDSRPDS